MAEYRVIWMIDVTAASPVAATAEAQAAQLRPGTLATVFDVMDRAAAWEGTRVDLAPDHGSVSRLLCTADGYTPPNGYGVEYYWSCDNEAYALTPDKGWLCRSHVQQAADGDVLIPESEARH